MENNELENLWKNDFYKKVFMLSALVLFRFLVKPYTLTRFSPISAVRKFFELFTLGCILACQESFGILFVCKCLCSESCVWEVISCNALMDSVSFDRNVPVTCSVTLFCWLLKFGIMQGVTGAGSSSAPTRTFILEWNLHYWLPEFIWPYYAK